VPWSIDWTSQHPHCPTQRLCYMLRVFARVKAPHAQGPVPSGPARGDPLELTSIGVLFVAPGAYNLKPECGSTN
jgi:hypothetical protein